MASAADHPPCNGDKRPRMDVETYKAAIESLTEPDDILAYLREMEARWGLLAPDDDDGGAAPPPVFDGAGGYGALMDHVLRALGLADCIASISEADLHEITRAQRAEIILFYHHVKNNAEVFGPQVANRISNMLGLFCFAEKLVHCAHRVKRIGVDGSNQILVDPKNFKKGLPSLPAPMPIGAEDEEHNTQFQSLLLFLLDKAQELGYYKYRDDVYKQILTPEGRKTYAWQAVFSIRDFVYDVTDKETNMEQWKNLTHGKNNAVSAAEFLTHCRDLQLPQLTKDRNVFAFSNGLYFSRLDAFWEYSSATPPPAGVVAAAKYFDMPFDAHAATRDWYDIPTPNLQKILAYQQFPEDVCKWMYVFLGRLMYNVGEVDGWQVIPFCKGQASSGKSTILLKVAKNFYDKEDVGILSNNIEKKFGISAFCDKYLFVAPEIKGDLQLEQAEFQSIVSGEDVQVAVKHATAKSVMWTTPGILAGNEVPNWTDNSGSITRRIVIWDFAKSVDNGEMDLGGKLAREMAAIIVKCNRAYLEAVEAVGQDNIWQHLPKYFADKRMELLACTNAVVSFIQSDSLERGPDKYMPFKDFRNLFYDYCIKNNLTKPKIARETWLYPFRQFGIQEELGSTRVYRGKPETGTWVLGIDAKEASYDHVAI
jgi:hypothetical protein